MAVPGSGIIEKLSKSTFSAVVPPSSTYTEFKYPKFDPVSKLEASVLDTEMELLVVVSVSVAESRTEPPESVPESVI